MSNRILIGDLNGEEVIRVAKPGYNVADVNLSIDGLSFDSRWQAVGKILLSGKTSLPSRTASDPVYSVTVWYGLALKRPPFAFAYVRDIIPNSSPGAWQLGPPQVFQDRLVFSTVPGGYNFAKDISYFVMAI